MVEEKQCQGPELIPWPAKEASSGTDSSHPGSFHVFSCSVQLACEGDLRVTKRSMFWGQGDDVLPDLPAGGEQGAAAQVQPLGDLEFVLDRRRRRRQ